MSTDTPLIEHIKYYEYNEFNSIEEIGSGLVGKVYKANWKHDEKCIALKSFNLDDATVKEIVHEFKLHKEISFNDMMIKFYGITKTDLDKKYLLVVEYAEGGTLCNYLKEKFPSLNWLDKYGLAHQLSSAIECLHKNGMVHKNLHSSSVFIQQNSIKLADFGLRKRIRDTSEISFDTIPYIDPKEFNFTAEKSPNVNLLEEDKQIEKFKLNKKSDVYSVGVLFWELSSGKKPFDDKEYNLFLALEIASGLREGIVDGTPKEFSNLYTKCWGGDPDTRPVIQEVIMTLESMMPKQIIQQLKLNHGLFLDGHKIEPSKQAVLLEDGEINMSLYKGQPLVYTFINDHSSPTNLLSFDPGDDDNFKLDESLQPSDVCINFPVTAITHNTSLESFSIFLDDDDDDDDERFYETYGHLFAKEVLVGGKLFIDGFKLATSTEINTFKSLLTWAYDSAKYNKENPFKNLSSLNFFPQIRTSDGENLNTLEKLTNWMNNLYQRDMTDIILYNNLIQLRSGTSSAVELQPRVANFKEKLNLEEWVGDLIYVDLTRWVKEFHLLKGLVINKYFELEISKKIAINFANVPEVVSSDKNYFVMIKPTTTLEEILISNNIVSAAENIGSFPFIKRSIKSDSVICRNYIHFLVKCERYKILLNKFGIRPSEKFKQAIDKALESMKPVIYLQEAFDKYGHFFPLSIVLGKSLKNILQNPSFSNFSKKKTDLESPTFESLKPHLDNLNISYLLTQKGNIVEKNELSNWIQNTNNDLEIIEYDNIISLYDILEENQRKKIDDILNIRDNFKIIMTGIADLKDLDNNNTEHFKRINIESSLEDENYDIFGSIISPNDLKLEEFFVTFGLYDFNGFSAMISKLDETNVNIEECYISWMIIGIPSTLSVYSPKNRDIKVDFFKKPITLQPNHNIELPFPLSQGYTISFNAHSTNFEIKNTIKLINWSYNSINIEIIQPTFNESNMVNSIPSDDNAQLDGDNNSLTNVEIAICVLSSDFEDFENLKIDSGKKGEYTLDLIGTILTENNLYEDNDSNNLLNDNTPLYGHTPSYSDNFQQQVITLTQHFILNGVLAPPTLTDPDPMKIYKELSLNKKRVKPINMRDIFRLFVSKEAHRIRITNFQVICKVTDSLLKAATYQEKLVFQNLATRVNMIIERNR